MKFVFQATIITFVCLLEFITAKRKRFEPTWESLDTHVAPSWYDESKLGIFMVWGVYSVPSFGTSTAGSEWFWETWKSKPSFWLLFFLY